MKKILSVALASAMVVAALPVAYAAENEADYTAGTQITYMGTQEEAAGGAGDVWTVTVPAKMVPGDTGTVKAEGMWDANKYLQVTAPKTISLAYGAQSMDVGITFGLAYSAENTGFALLGNSISEVTTSHDLTVAEASRLFGTWTGVLNYDVNLVEKGDMNQDGVINKADLDVLKDLANSSTSDDLQYADLDGNGAINSMDVVLFKKILGQNGIEIASE